MLTGRRAFEGEDERDWTKLPANTPSSIRTLVRCCLEKDRKRRLADIADARLETDDALAALKRRSGWSDEVTAPTTLAVASRARVRFVWGLTGIALGAVAASVAILSTLTRQDQSSPQPLMRLSVALPSSAPLHLDTLPMLALSPDGTRLVYVADSGSGRRQLFLRSLGSWGADDTIVFMGASGLMRIAASGGAPTPLPSLDRRLPGAPWVLWPDLLPGSKTVLLNVPSGGSRDEDLIAVQSLETGETRTLDVKGSYPRFASSGHIVYARRQGLWAVPFDLARQTLTGPPVLVLEGVMVHPPSGAAQFALSANGTLLYVPFTARMAAGRKPQPFLATSHPEGWGEFSPDGRWLAYTSLESGRSEIHVRPFPGPGATIKVSTDGGAEAMWAPNGRELFYRSEDRMMAVAVTTHPPSPPPSRACCSRDISREGLWRGWLITT